jgi:pyrroloquinoline quinone biosynthesis protein E
MPQPCQSCVRKDVDFGGCRCQAFLLTGDAAATDPVCSKSPRREVIDSILAGTPVVPPELVMRKNTIKVVQ